MASTLDPITSGADRASAADGTVGGDLAPRPHGRTARAIDSVTAAIAAAPTPVTRLRRGGTAPAPRVWDYTKPTSPLKHLAERFFTAMRPGEPSAAATAWAQATLTPAEWALFTRLPAFDRRHAIGVGKVASTLRGNDPVVARAGLLHDIGKLDCGLSPIGRSFATIVRRLFPATADRWVREWLVRVAATPDGRVPAHGVRQQFASYWSHPWTGRHMLEAAGSEPAVASWAEHHDFWFVAEDLVVSWDDACALWLTDGD